MLLEVFLVVVLKLLQIELAYILDFRIGRDVQGRDQVRAPSVLIMQGRLNGIRVPFRLVNWFQRLVPLPGAQAPLHGLRVFHVPLAGYKLLQRLLPLIHRSFQLVVVRDADVGFRVAARELSAHLRLERGWLLFVGLRLAVPDAIWIFDLRHNGAGRVTVFVL